MIMDVSMPQLGESVTEGQIVRWLKAPGERVGRFEALVEVLTDKVTVEVPSPAEGVLVATRVAEGETVPVGTVIAVLDAVAPGATEGAQESAPLGAAIPAAPNSVLPPSAQSGGEGGGRGAYSPAVRRLAKEHGVDLATVTGTGEGGRVTREDVLRHVQGRAERPSTHSAPPASESAGVPGPGGEAVTPSPVRQRVARRMVESWTSTPHAWTMVEADVSALVSLREQVREAFLAREGFELTYLPFAIHAAVGALREWPELNSSWRDGQIVRHRSVHVGVAVGLDDALVVPVIREAERLSITGIARTLHDLVERARHDRLSPDDLSGGTFTVNNTGALGSILSAPIINPPQAGILTTEAVTKRLVVLKDDQISIRSVMNLCLSFDHRVADGVHALRFLQAVRRRLESYGPGWPLS